MREFSPRSETLDRHRSSLNLVVARERLDEAALGELPVGHAGEHDILHVGLQRHGQTGDVSVHVGEEDDFHLLESIERVGRNLKHIVVIVLQRSSYLVECHLELVAIRRNGNHPIPGVRVIAGIILQIVRRMGSRLARRVALVLGFLFGFLTARFGGQSALIPRNLIETEQPVEDAVGDDSRQRVPIQIGQDDDANFVGRQKRKIGAEAVDVPAVTPPVCAHGK